MRNRRLLRDRLFDVLDMMNPEGIFVSSIINAHPDHRVFTELRPELAQANGPRSGSGIRGYGGTSRALCGGT